MSKTNDIGTVLFVRPELMHVTLNASPGANGVTRPVVEAARP